MPPRAPARPRAILFRQTYAGYSGEENVAPNRKLFPRGPARPDNWSPEFILDAVLGKPSPPVVSISWRRSWPSISSTSSMSSMRSIRSISSPPSISSMSSKRSISSNSPISSVSWTHSIHRLPSDSPNEAPVRSRGSPACVPTSRSRKPTCLRLRSHRSSCCRTERASTRLSRRRAPHPTNQPCAPHPRLPAQSTSSREPFF